jgi:hypothetical protein
MDQQKLKELLHLQPEDISEPTPFCPDGGELVARLQGDRTDADQERLERHLVDCSYCRAQAAVLTRFMQSGTDAQIPDALLVQASQLGNRPRRRRSRLALHVAAAAVTVIALTAVLTHSQNPDSDLSGVWRTIAGAEPEEVRNIDSAYRGPKLLAPSDGSRIRPDELTVRWTEVPGSIYYDVRLVDVQGFVLWQDRVKERYASPPSQLQLEAGERYFVRVDAYLAESKRVSSDHVTFIYQGRN